MTTRPSDHSFRLSMDVLREARFERLQDVAKVRLGFAPAKEPRLRSDDWGLAERSPWSPQRDLQSTFVIQPSSIGNDGAIDWNRVERVDLQPGQKVDVHALAPGMVLLGLRGVTRVVALTDASLRQDRRAPSEPMPVTASTAWAVIEPNRARLDSRYLAWQLALPSAMTELQRTKTGSALHFIPVKAVQDWTLPVPTLPAQEHLARLIELLDRIRTLETERDRLTRQYITGCFPRREGAKRPAQPTTSPTSPGRLR